MQGILNAFDFIINTIRSVWGFFTGLIEQLILLWKVLMHGFRLAIDCLLTMPDWLQAFGFITVGISVMYLILNRNGGKSA